MGKTWELTGMPLLASYAILSPWMNRELLLNPYGTLPEIWGIFVALFLVGVAIQFCCKGRKQMDLDDPNGEQNDVVRALLANEPVNTSNLMNARFPEVSKAMATGGINDMFALTKETHLQGQLGGKRGEPLTENQIKI